MSFHDGPNRPPRRQSAKNIDFRRLADVNNHSDDEEDVEDKKSSLRPKVKKCDVCKRVIQETDFSLIVRNFILTFTMFSCLFASTFHYSLSSNFNVKHFSYDFFASNITNYLSLFERNLKHFFARRRHSIIIKH